MGLDNLVYEFSKNTSPQIEDVGSKAYSLSLLISQGFNVASGFVLTTGIYDLITSNDIRLLERKNAIKKYWLSSSISQGGIMNFPPWVPSLPQQVSKIVVDKWIQLGSIPVIARSSATNEDNKSASFAGVYSSVLNLQSSDTLITAIEEVYKSTFSFRMIEYINILPTFGKSKAENLDSKMAVIIQKMVTGMVSGIAFSRSPITGAKEIVIEAQHGNNHNLVDGLASPQTIVFPYENTKSINKERMKSSPLHDNFYLSLESINNLLVSIWQIEDILGRPADIEWTITANNKLYILQARPITTI